MKQFHPEMLLNSSAYDHSVDKVELRETHISWVFLSGDFAYKVKKPVKFGDILDFSTLELPKKFCEEEIALNSRFSPDLYLSTFYIDDLGRINGPGTIIEYGVKMKRLPEEYLLINLLKEKKVPIESVSRIAEMIANFHANSNKVPEYGDVKYIGEKWDENFRTTATFRSIDESFREKIKGFLHGNRGLFKERVNTNRITDNHGDFQSQNIFVLPNHEVVIFDCIEFSSLLRYGDVAEDVGFLAMDLDFLDERELSNYFVEMYVKFSGDELIQDNISFFKSYRAYVRGKVYGFQASEEADSEKRKELLKMSEKYYTLAYQYSENW